MSAAKRPAARIEVPSPAQCTSKQALPIGHHLAVTTQDRIVALDNSGSTTLFTSKSQGILAARSSKDGSGRLAVADDAMVILHDVGSDRLQETRSWRLKGDKDRRRLLGFSRDGNILFFTTPLLDAVQCFNTREQKLQEPGPLHPTLPTVFALSSSGHLMLSASNSPPIAYLTNLEHRTSRAVSSTSADVAISAAAFHPDQPDIFAIAIQNGTVTAYDATRVGRSDASDGKVAEFENLHIVTTGAGSRVGKEHFTVPAVAFLPGFRCRLVSVGSDGRCHILDFSTGNILKSWHLKAPATSVTVMKINRSASSAKEMASRGSSTIQLKDIVIAAGRADGKAVIHDAAGNQLREIAAQTDGRPVLGVQWIASPRPASPVSTIRISSSEDEAWVDVYGEDGRLRARTKTQTGSAEGCPSANIVRSPISDGKTITKSVDGLPKEIPNVEGTVIRSRVVDDAPAVSPGPSKGAYMDLFSPVKQSQPVVISQPSRKRSPTRLRARLLSSTFTELADKPRLDIVAQSPVASVERKMIRIVPKDQSDGPSDQSSVETHNSATIINETKRRLSKGTSDPGRAVTGAHLRSVSNPAQASITSRILHDIRQLSNPDTSRADNSRGERDSLLAAYKSKPKRSTDDSRTKTSRRSDGRRTSYGLPVLPPTTSLLPSVVSLDEASSLCSSSLHTFSPDASQLVIDHDGGDIWLTDNSEDDATHTTHRFRRHTKGHRHLAKGRGESGSSHAYQARGHTSDPLNRESTLQRIYYSYSIGDEVLSVPGPSIQYQAATIQDHPLFRTRSSPHPSPGSFIPEDPVGQYTASGPPKRRPTGTGESVISYETVYPNIDPSPTDSWRSVHLLSVQQTPAQGLSRRESAAHPTVDPPQSTSVTTQTTMSTTRGAAGSFAPELSSTNSSEATVDIPRTLILRRPSAAELLPAGFAESRLGPVEVQRWLPRQGSLAHALNATGLSYSKTPGDRLSSRGPNTSKIRNKAARRSSRVTLVVPSPRKGYTGNARGTTSLRPAQKRNTVIQDSCQSCNALLLENEMLRAEVKRLQGLVHT